MLHFIKLVISSDLYFLFLFRLLLGGYYRINVVRENKDVQRVLGEPIRCSGEHAGWIRRGRMHYKVGYDQHTFSFIVHAYRGELAAYMWT